MEFECLVEQAIEGTAQVGGNGGLEFQFAESLEVVGWLELVGDIDILWCGGAEAVEGFDLMAELMEELVALVLEQRSGGYLILF